MTTATQEQVPVCLRGDTIVIGVDYEVALADVYSQMELVNWIKHLSRKRWATLPLIEQFIDLVCKAKGWPVDG
jgi:hypothetical protein